MNPINSAKKLLGLLLLSLLIPACGGETILTPGEATTDVLSVAHNTWKTNGYSNYTFEVKAWAMTTIPPVALRSSLNVSSL